MVVWWQQQQVDGGVDVMVRDVGAPMRWMESEDGDEERDNVDERGG